MGRRGLLLGGTSGVPEGGVSHLDSRDDGEPGPPALEPPVDQPKSCLVVALAEFVGVLESTLMGEALDEEVDGLAEL